MMPMSQLPRSIISTMIFIERGSRIYVFLPFQNMTTIWIICIIFLTVCYRKACTVFLTWRRRAVIPKGMGSINKRLLEEMEAVKKEKKWKIRVDIPGEAWYSIKAVARHGPTRGQEMKKFEKTEKISWQSVEAVIKYSSPRRSGVHLVN